MQINQEYENKKRECWEEFRALDRKSPYSLREVNAFAFDRGYALGKAYCAEAEAEEETLSVSRSRVQEVYSYNEEILSQDPTHSGAILLKKKLTDLFGSKCLPDETCNLASSDVASSGGKEVNFTSKAQTTTNCSSYDDRRLQIAAQILAALYANELYARHRYMEQLVETALKATDMLIAECGKGDKNGE